MFSVMKSNTTSNCGKEVLQYGVAKPYWMEEGIYMTKTKSYHIRLSVLASFKDHQVKMRMLITDHNGWEGSRKLYVKRS